MPPASAPAARATFVAPMLRAPTSRTSRPAKLRVAKRLNGIDPAR